MSATAAPASSVSYDQHIEGMQTGFVTVSARDLHVRDWIEGDVLTAWPSNPIVDVEWIAEGIAVVEFADGARYQRWGRGLRDDITRRVPYAPAYA